MESLSNRSAGQANHHELDPPTPHCVLLISAMFCMLGGALIILSGVLSWVVDVGVSGMTFEAGREWFLTDLTAMSSSYDLYIAALTGGVMVILLSVICLMTEKTGKKRIWPVTAIMTALIITIVVVITAFWINVDMMTLSDTAALGPAPFIAVFGCVLTLAGGFILTLNSHQEANQQEIRFISRTAAKEVEEELPCPNGTTRCPGCLSPIEADWEICPVCGIRFAGPSL